MIQNSERQYEEVVGFVEAEDLVRNGGEGCDLLEDEPCADFVTVYKNGHSHAMRGSNYVDYRGLIIASEISGDPGQMYETGPTVGLLSDAAEVLTLIWKKTGVI